MQFIKYCMLFLVFIASALIGKYISQKYKFRVDELEEIKNALNIFKSKIKFTYEPIPEIFKQISENTNKNVSKLFSNAVEKMQTDSAGVAFEKSVDEYCGITDSDGQLSQIEVTENFLDEQIRQAQEEKNKNEKLYKKLGMSIGMAIVIILM